MVRRSIINYWLSISYGIAGKNAFSGSKNRGCGGENAFRGREVHGRYPLSPIIHLSPIISLTSHISPPPITHIFPHHTYLSITPYIPILHHIPLTSHTSIPSRISPPHYLITWSCVYSHEFP